MHREECPGSKLVFRDINVSINKCQILQDISGCVQSKEILAVMGPSGSGKTTLLNTIAGRVGIQSGNLELNGQRLNKQLRRKLAYVLQADLFYSNLTMWETLYFTAMLNLPDKIPKEEKLLRIDEVIQALDLEKCRNTRIGGVMDHGLSGGEKKRLSIGCELLTDPYVMLLDEPTSGLDSSTAYSLMVQLKRYAEISNKAIVVTIHQPSSQLYHIFSKLLLIANGQTAYYGSPFDALDYFKNINLICEEHYNPADFMLEILKRGEDTTDGILDAWVRSDFNGTVLDNQKSALNMQSNQLNGKHLESGDYPSKKDKDYPNNGFMSNGPFPISNKGDCKETIDRKGYLYNNATEIGDISLQQIKVIDPGESDVISNQLTDAKWQSSFWTQFTMLTWRNFKESRSRILSKYAMCSHLIIAICVGLIWFDIESSYKTIRDRMGWLFFVAVFWGFTPILDANISFPREKTIMMKERAAGSYRLSAYYLAKSVSELPLMILSPIIFISIAYWMAGLKGLTEFIGTVLIIINSVLCFQGIGYIIGGGFMDFNLAMTTTSTYMLCSLICGGFYNKTFPYWLQWIKYLSALHYPFGAMCHLEFSDISPIVCSNVSVIEFPRCNDNTTEVITTRMILEDYTISIPFHCYVSSLIILTVGLRIIGYYVLRIRTRQKYL